MSAPEAPREAEPLLPCPFCGWSAEPDTERGVVRCPNCGAQGPDEPMRAFGCEWNLRAAVARAGDAGRAAALADAPEAPREAGEERTG